MKPAVSLCVLACAFTAATAQPALNDQPSTAYIQSLAIDPQNPQRLYAGAMGDGLYLSEDAGENWRPVAALSSLRSVQVVKIDWKDPRRLFAGGERSGVWMSTDRGENWRLISPDTLTVCDIALHPENPDHLLVLADDGVYRCKNLRTAPWELVFNHTAFQQKWRAATNLPFFWKYTRFQKIEFNPHHPQTVFVGARWEGGYHRSDDGGDTWRHLSLGGIFRRVDPILFHPTDPDIIMVGTHHQGLFKSYNAGASWVSMSIGMEPQRRTPYYGAYLVSGIALAPSNPNTLYTGSDHSNWKSLDGGLSWQEMGKSLTCPFARAFAVHPKNENIVYAGTNVGIYKSTDGGQTWTFSSRGLPAVAILPPVDLPLQDGLYRFALADKKPLIYRRSLNPLGNWTPINWLLPEAGVLLEKGAGANELRLVSESTTYASYDGGLRWNYPDPRFADVASQMEPLPFAGDASDPSQWTLDVEFAGKVFFDDQWLGTYYRRPPYVALYLVSQDYPCDHSKPYWQSNLDRALQFTVQIPKTVVPKKDALLYCEVRDFHRNTLTGFAAVKPGKRKKVTVSLAPDNRLPALQALFDQQQSRR